MARQHRWATDRLLVALGALDDDDYHRAPGPGQASVHGLLSAMLAFERGVWWERIAAVVPQPAAAGGMASGRDELARQLHDTAAAWHGLIDAWTEDRLHGQLRHQEGVAAPELLSHAEALLQVFGQASHCRGQLCAALAMAGRPVPALDLISMLNEETASR